MLACPNSSCARTSGRRPQVAKIGALDEVRQAFRTGASIAALAREHRVSRGAIRTAVADLLPDQPERSADAAEAEPEMVRVEVPGKIVRHLHDHGGLGDGAASSTAGTRGPTRPGLQPAHAELRLGGHEVRDEDAARLSPFVRHHVNAGALLVPAPGTGRRTAITA